MEEPIHEEHPSKQRSWKRYMLDWNLQLGYLSIYFVTIAVFMTGFVTLNVIFLLLLKQERADSIGASIELSEDFLPFLIYNTVLVVFVAIAMATYSIIHSHRVAGPIFRLRQSLQRLRRGDYNFSLHFRERDFFHDVAEHINDLNESLLYKDNRIADLVEELSVIRDKIGSGEPSDKIDSISNELAELIHADVIESRAVIQDADSNAQTVVDTPNEAPTDDADETVDEAPQDIPKTDPGAENGSADGDSDASA